MDLPVGERLNETNALQMAADLALADPAEPIRVDFTQTQHYEPFAMLLVGSAINRARKRSGQSVQVTTGTGAAENIAGHMGFWQRVGVPLGRAVNAGTSHDSYLPITAVNVGDLYKEAGYQDPIAAGIVERESARLASVLNRSRSPVLAEALTYMLRELIRNVIEHARTQTLWLAGMSWPKRDLVQVAVLDEGIGVRASLGQHAQFRYPTDADAIRAAMAPGVTRNLGREPSRAAIERHAEGGHDRPITFFQNSGYGLYAISTLCREAGGQFMLASGSGAIACFPSADVPASTGHHGTAVRVVLPPSETGDAMDRLFEGTQLRGPAGRKPLLTASTLRQLGLDSLVADAPDQAAP